MFEWSWDNLVPKLIVGFIIGFYIVVFSEWFISSLIKFIIRGKCGQEKDNSESATQVSGRASNGKDHETDLRD